MAETSLGRRLTTVDAGFIYFERPNQPLHVGGCLIYEGQLSRDELIEAVQDRLHLMPRYRQRLMFPPFDIAHPIWEDDPDFDIRTHITEDTLPPPGDDRVLSEFGGQVFAPMLPRDRPLWQMVVLHGRPDGTTAVIWKVHHAMVDGVSVVDLLMTLHDLSPRAEPPPAPSPWSPRPLPDALTLMEEAVRDQLTLAAQRWTEDLFRRPSSPSAEELTRQLTEAARGAFTPAAPAPPMPFNGPLSERRQFVWADFAFAEVRRVKSLLGGTVNDLVLAVIAGAVGRYLRHHGYRTAGLELRTQCPVSMRSSEQRGALGNRVTSLIVPLYAGIDDPIQRLNAQRAAMDRLKAQDQAGRLYALAELSDRVPPAWQALAGRWQGDPPAVLVHTVASNVPGPQVPLYLKGHKALAIRLNGPLGGATGIFNAIFSYNQTLAISVLVDPALVPDPWRYAECLTASFDELRAAAAQIESAAA